MKMIFYQIAIIALVFFPVAAIADTIVRSDTNPAMDNTVSKEDPSDTSDVAITSKIQDKLSSDSNLSSLTVTTNNGVVTLSGNVDSGTQKNEAIAMAKSINGVKKVNSSINISK